MTEIERIVEMLDRDCPDWQFRFTRQIMSVRLETLPKSATVGDVRLAWQYEYHDIILRIANAAVAAGVVTYEPTP